MREKRKTGNWRATKENVEAAKQLQRDCLACFVDGEELTVPQVAKMLGASRGDIRYALDKLYDDGKLNKRKFETENISGYRRADFKTECKAALHRRWVSDENYTDGEGSSL